MKHEAEYLLGDTHRRPSQSIDVEPTASRGMARAWGGRRRRGVETPTAAPASRRSWSGLGAGVGGLAAAAAVVLGVAAMPTAVGAPVAKPSVDGAGGTTTTMPKSAPTTLGIPSATPAHKAPAFGKS